jgi:hypothetical protein
MKPPKTQARAIGAVSAPGATPSGQGGTPPNVLDKALFIPESPLLVTINKVSMHDHAGVMLTQ